MPTTTDVSEPGTTDKEEPAEYPPAPPPPPSPPHLSLRLVVMEGVPWVKPSVLHAARRMAHQAATGRGTLYDDDLVRTRLAQAFGRLIRRQNDKGTFVLLSSAVPSRLLSAFPDGTPVRRVTLEEAVTEIAGSHSALPTQRHLSHELDR